MNKTIFHFIVIFSLVSCFEDIKNDSDGVIKVFINDSTYLDIYNNEKECSIIKANILNGDTLLTSLLFENNKLFMIESEMNNKLDGKQYLFHSNGDIFNKSEYSKGVEVGHWVSWYESSQKMSEGWYEFKEGDSLLPQTQSSVYSFNGKDYYGEEVCSKLKNGSWINYHPNGEIKGIELYDNGTRIGTWIEYDSLGLVVDSIVYPCKTP
tara:strand:- start:164 stop:790 length:627 start_codon:yes stop_codon:yes gene_type:complete